jgi:hypothetical protein
MKLSNFRRHPFQPFEKIPEELIIMILYPLLVRQNSIEIGSRPIVPPFPQACSVLLVSKRFHHIAEHIIYRFNTFHIWSSDLWFWNFASTLSRRGYRTISKLRLQWPDKMCPAAPSEVLDILANCAGLMHLELLCFPEHVSDSILKRIDELPIKEIWVEDAHSYLVRLWDRNGLSATSRSQG